MTDDTPRVARIAIFPIKALDPVELPCAAVLPSGALADDRRWAMFDGDGRVVSGKTHAGVHRIRARFDMDARRVGLRRHGEASEAVFGLDGPLDALEAWLGHSLDRSIHLREQVTTGFPDDMDSPGPTVISTATLAEIARWFDLPLDQTRARFRTNIEIDGVPAFWEDCLFGAADEEVPFRLGRAALVGVNPCQRCIVPTRDAWTGVRDGGFAPRFARMRAQTRPAWSNPARFNHFYRLAVNTRAGGPGGSVSVGDRLLLRSEVEEAADAVR